jgi:hypothetical protein
MIDRHSATEPVANLPAATWLVPWAALAALLSLSGVFTLERRLLIPLCLVAAVSTLIVCHRRFPRFRSWVNAIDLRTVLLVHAVRAPIGVGFLVMEAQGKLSGAFARVAGYGDIAVGLSALVLLWSFGPRDRRQPTRGLLLWNALGLLDILIVVGQAQRLLLFVDPQGIMALAAFPGSMLPTFVVPIVITTHLLVFVRAFARG